MADVKMLDNVIKGSSLVLWLEFVSISSVKEKLFKYLEDYQGPILVISFLQ